MITLKINRVCSRDTVLTQQIVTSLLWKIW